MFKTSTYPLSARVSGKRKTQAYSSAGSDSFFILDNAEVWASFTDDVYSGTAHAEDTSSFGPIPAAQFRNADDGNVVVAKPSAGILRKSKNIARSWWQMTVKGQASLMEQCGVRGRPCESISSSCPLGFELFFSGSADDHRNGRNKAVH